MAIELVPDSRVIFSCEGGFENLAVNMLLDADYLVIPKAHVVKVANERSASAIQSRYLQFEYDWPVTIVRVVDSRSERFELGALYRDRYPVVNVLTRPESEMLIILREGCYADYAKRKSKMMPSDYCKQVLGFQKVKSRDFLQGYWDADKLVEAAMEYRRVSKLSKDERCLADLLRTDAG